MIAALVKKDCLLLLRNHFVAAVAALIFILIMLSANLGIVGYYMMVLAGIWQLLTIVSEMEKKTGAAALLAVTPYTRKTVVAGRYVSAMLFWAALTVVYLVISLALGFSGFFPPLTLEIAARGFLGAALFTAVALPISIRLPLMAARFLTLFIVLGSMFLVLGLRDTLAPWLVAVTLAPAARLLLCLAVGVAALALSRVAAVRLAARMEG